MRGLGILAESIHLLSEPAESKVYRRGPVTSNITYVRMGNSFAYLSAVQERFQMKHHGNFSVA